MNCEFPGSTAARYCLLRVEASFLPWNFNVSSGIFHSVHLHLRLVQCVRITASRNLGVSVYPNEEGGEMTGVGQVVFAVSTCCMGVNSDQECAEAKISVCRTFRNSAIKDVRASPRSQCLLSKCRRICLSFLALDKNTQEPIYLSIV